LLKGTQAFYGIRRIFWNKKPNRFLSSISKVKIAFQ